MLRTLFLVFAVLFAVEAQARASTKQLLSPPTPPGLSASARAGANLYRGYLGAEARPSSTATLLRVSASGQLPLSRVEAPAGRTREELKAEFQRLDDNVPGLGLPIAMIVTGGIGSFFGVYVLLLGVVFQSAPVAIVGGLVLLGSVALGVTGSILLANRIKARVERMRRMDQIEEELRGAPADAAPVIIERQRGLRPQLVLARF